MELPSEHNNEKHKKVRGVSQHGFRAAAEVAFAHYEANHPGEKKTVRVAAFYVSGENPVRDYIVQLVPPGD